MSWVSKPIRDGVQSGLSEGLSKGLSGVLEADRKAASTPHVPKLPEDLAGRIKWAGALWRDAKARSAENAPSALGKLVAFGELRILTQLLLGWDAERKAAQAMEAAPAGETEGLDAKHESAVVEDHAPELTPGDHHG